MEININKYQKDPKNNARREIIITYFDTDNEIPTAIQVYDKNKHTFISKSFKSLGIDNQNDIKENKSVNIDTEQETNAIPTHHHEIKENLKKNQTKKRKTY